MSQPNSKQNGKRCAWEAPRLIELKIRAHTKSRTEAQDASQPAAPVPPTAPKSKLGFSFEWGFPLAFRGAED
jgi:hypothetical protein